MPGDRGLRYETLVATLIGLLAVGVSAYTAYIQRQQVRAQVWPILEFNTGNVPEIGFWLANKGSGPALIRHVVVTVDGNPIPDWKTAMATLLGPGTYRYSVDGMSSRALSAGERLDVFAAHFESGSADPRFARFDKERFRVGAEICFCSTLGECWTLRSPANEPATTVETSRCPQTPGFRQ